MSPDPVRIQRMLRPETQNLVRQAAEAFRARRFREAVEFLARAAELEPGSPELRNDLGIACAAYGDLHRAIDSYRQSLQLRSDYPEVNLNLGNALRDLGDWPGAVEAYRLATQLRPSFVEAHHALGTALRETGSIPEAIQSYETALRLRPRSAALHNDLGVTYARAGDSVCAAESFQNAIRLDPSYPKPYRNLGRLLLQTGRFAEAAELLEHLVLIEPNSATAQHDLATALVRLGKFEPAIAHFRAAVTVDPDFGPAWCNLGLALEDAGRCEEALDALRRAADRMPDSPVVAYHLAAMGGGSPPAICPPEYVVELFDSYTDRFEQHLVGTLNYRGPELLLEAVHAAKAGECLDVIDLGCGTGLCGELFKRMARSLVGVDLSPRMLEASRRRGIYDELLQEDVAHTLQSRPARFDLALAGDLFIYIGDLAPIFRAAFIALRADGLLAFTLEHLEAGDYALRPPRRYAHSTQYISRLAATAGFKIVMMHHAVLRRGEGGDVDGTVLVLRRAIAR